jgi:hypothetical protein
VRRDTVAVPCQPSRRQIPGKRHVPGTLRPDFVSGVMSFPKQTARGVRAGQDPAQVPAELSAGWRGRLGVGTSGFRDRCRGRLDADAMSRETGAVRASNAARALCAAQSRRGQVFSEPRNGSCARGRERKPSSPGSPPTRRPWPGSPWCTSTRRAPRRCAPPAGTSARKTGPARPRSAVYRAASLSTPT